MSPSALAAGALLALAACASHGSLPMDIHSHCRPERVRVEHASLDLELDPRARRLTGSVVLRFVRLDPKAPLVLDAQGLKILGVTGADGKARAFELSAEDAHIGSALSIALEPQDREVKVAYHTTERADALQWLEPEQTRDRRGPFLFTQGQSILTRTWIPLQDSPGVRMTYDARVRAPSGLTVVMSAEQLGQDPDGAFRFRMPQPIPPYLIALACGAIEFRPISERCGIWAEPSLVEDARDELADTERMIASAEALFGPYRWGRYDLIVLPPSFPFGGMENPRMTFATPTILAGDGSLVSLVAHELAHSWSGNLVTNATWRDFWLNEGFTVYFESRIMEQVYGAERARMETLLGIRELKRNMRELAPRDQVLRIDLEGRSPDDGFSDVPYVKGALFLFRIEELFGRARFDRFLTAYFDAHAFQSITTEQFLAYLDRHLFAQDRKAAQQIDLAHWLDAPGLPPDAPRPRSASLERVDAQIARWVEQRSVAELDTQGWVTQQWLHFLEGIGAALDKDSMAALDARFHFIASENSEILCAWLRLAIAHRYAAADERLEQFLMTVGRRKFLKPLYTELAKTPEGLAFAREVYARARPRYHAVSTGTVDKLLQWR